MRPVLLIRFTQPTSSESVDISSRISFPRPSWAGASMLWYLALLCRLEHISVMIWFRELWLCSKDLSLDSLGDYDFIDGSLSILISGPLNCRWFMHINMISTMSKSPPARVAYILSMSDNQIKIDTYVCTHTHISATVPQHGLAFWWSRLLKWCCWVVCFFLTKYFKFVLRFVSNP